MTSARTGWLCVLGWPVEHSRSPAIHTAALQAAGIDAVYLAHAVAPERLAEAVAGLRALGAIGANVTLPHKERVLGLCDELEPAARAIGAVNTIVREDDRLIGTNTDGAGLARALAEAGVELAGKRVLIVGAGGAARASAFGLAEAGAAELIVAARKRERADALVSELARATKAAMRAIDLRDAREPAASADLFVQATSATLGDGAEAASFASALPIDALPASASVIDLVYAPRETAVMRAAAARGLRTIDGLGMLVWQAALAFERWFGRAAPIDAMRRAAE